MNKLSAGNSTPTAVIASATAGTWAEEKTDPKLPALLQSLRGDFFVA